MTALDVMKEEFLILTGISGMLWVSQLLMSIVRIFFMNLVLFCVAVYSSIYYAEIMQHDRGLGRNLILSSRIGMDLFGIGLGLLGYICTYTILKATSIEGPSDIMTSMSESSVVTQIFTYAMYLYCADYTFLAAARFLCNGVRLIKALLGFSFADY